MVTGNVMRRLEEYFRADANWGVVTELAGLLLTEGALEGERLQALLQRQDGATETGA